MKYIKIIGGIIITIILGAIGSGVWEKILSPFFYYIVQFSSNIYSGYLDAIYDSASMYIPDIYQIKISFLILIIVSLSMIFFSLKNGNWKFNGFININKELKQNFHIMGLLMGSLLFAFSIFTLSFKHYAYEIKQYSFHSLEVLRPYIGERKYLLLKSQYYQISSTQDFNNFNSLLIDISKEHNIELRKIELIK